MAKRVADSITVVEKRRVDSLRLAREREITERMSSGAGLSLKKVKVTGHGLLLSKDKTWREYTIRMDDFNRILVTYEGDTRVRGELDVLKVIYESEWGLLSDDLFHNVEIVKATAEISQGARTKKFGVFSFLFMLNLDDLDMVHKDLPDMIWLACGGSEGLNSDRCNVLRGRNVILFPDSGQYEKWSAKAKALSRICTASVSLLIEQQATEQERKAGFDIADYFVRFTPQQIRID